MNRKSTGGLEFMSFTVFYIPNFFFNKHVSLAHFSKSDFSVLYIKHMKSLFRYNKLFWNCRKPSKQVIINKSLRVNGFWSQMVSVRILSLPS